MRNWTTLADRVNAFLQHPAIYPDNITTDLRKELRCFDLLAIERLESFLRLPIADAEKEKRLRRFFAMRWTAIANTSLDYTFNPHSPANQTCLLVAKHIRKDDEATCLILMPTIEKVLGSSFPDDVKMSSEDLEDQFILSNFLTSENGSALIALEDLLSRARVNPDLFFSVSDTDSEDDEHSTVIPNLTAEDRQRVRDVFGEGGAPYFDALEKMHRVLNGEHLTVGHALQTLAHQLLRGSVIAEGTDAHAKFAECYQPISAFYHIWFDLSEPTRKQIALYCPEHSHAKRDSLESQLLCLFYAASLRLTDAERNRVAEEGNIECAHQIGLALEGISRFHLKALTGIPLPGKEKEYECEVVPDNNELQLKMQQCINALSNRGAFLGARDEVIVINALFFDTLTEHAFDPVFSNKDVETLCNQVSSIQDFISGLLLLPPEQWKNMIVKIGVGMDSILATDGKSWDALSFILKQLPTQHWKIFCDALCALPCIARIINARDLARLMPEFPEKQFIFLPMALEMLSGHVLAGVREVAFLFPHALLLQWTQQYLIFRSHIKTILDNPTALTKVFQLSQRQDWSHLVAVLHEIFVEQLQQKDFFTKALLEFSDPDKVLFVEAVASILGDQEVTQGHVMDIVRGIGVVKCESLFPMLGSEQVTQWIPTEAALSKLLNELETPVHRIIFVCAFTHAPLLFQPDPQAFYELLNRFPECQAALLKVFRHQLSRILQNFVVTLSAMRAYKQTVPEKFYDHFRFYMETVLPALFSQEILEKLISRLERITVIPALAAVEQKVEDKTLTPLAGAFEKIELLYRFIQQQALHRHRDHESDLLMRSLLTIFGNEFFQDILKYKDEDLTLLRAQCCLITATNASTQASNQRFFALRPRPPVRPENVRRLQ